MCVVIIRVITLNYIIVLGYFIVLKMITQMIYVLWASQIANVCFNAHTPTPGQFKYKIFTDQDFQFSTNANQTKIDIDSREFVVANSKDKDIHAKYYYYFDKWTKPKRQMGFN